MYKNSLQLDQPLLAAFQSAFVSAVTIQAAQYEAERSENEVVQHLQAVSSGQYLQPGSLNVEQDAVTRASLDAHIKKVQAEQLSSMNSVELQRLWQQTRHDYIGRRVQINVIMPKKQPVTAVWYDQRYGYRDGVARRSIINGIIEDILLDRNALLIKPSTAARILNSSLQNFVVYVIDPETCTPMVNFFTKQ